MKREKRALKQWTTKEISTQLDLKPCPFCGGTPVVVGAELHSAKGVLIKCKKCGAGRNAVAVGMTYDFLASSKMTLLTLDQAIEKAVAGWNMRI